MMTEELPFPHHTFESPLDCGQHRFVSSDQAVPSSDVDQCCLPEVSEILRSSGVRKILLLHGTFAGNDIIGWMRTLSRVSPRLSATMKELGKQWLDQLVGEVGNYTSKYAELLQQIIDGRDAPIIGVQRFHWSGENHHLGRACAVVALLDQLFQEQWKETDRLLLLAHSHGGNVLAMMTLLLGGSAKAKQAFFQATGGHSDQQVWQRVQTSLMDEDRLRSLPHLDIVTFGTPLRYRWNTGVVDNLLHVVHHRCSSDVEPARAMLPRSIGDVMHAVGGDYVQHLGIGGTDFPHRPLAWTAHRSERQLRRIFEPTAGRRDLKKNLSAGHRVSLDGTTLLVDYSLSLDQQHQKLLGHGIYTCKQWLPFHLQTIASEFYDGSS